VVRRQTLASLLTSDPIYECNYTFLIILDLSFSRLMFSVELQLSGMSRLEYWELSNVSTKIVVAIFRLYMYLLVGLSGNMYGREWEERWI
jgi:hypothetical protein